MKLKEEGGEIDTATPKRGSPHHASGSHDTEIAKENLGTYLLLTYPQFPTPRRRASLHWGFFVLQHLDPPLEPDVPGPGHREVDSSRASD